MAAGDFVLGKGKSEIVFNRSTTGSGFNFNIEVDTGNYMGALILQAVGHTTVAPPFTGAALTAFVGDLEISLDGGVTWNKIVSGVTLTSLAQMVNVNGMGAGCLLRLTSTTFTLGAASFIAVYAAIG